MQRIDAQVDDISTAEKPGVDQDSVALRVEVEGPARNVAYQPNGQKSEDTDVVTTR